MVVRAQNYKCVRCGEVIPFEGRELYLEHGLRNYRAQMIVKKDYEVSG